METQIYVSDYASYNEGSLIGEWIDLTQFTEASEFGDYVSKMFKKFDKTNPLDFNYPREEPMYQDYEGFPRELYSEGCFDDRIIEYVNLPDHERDSVDIILGAYCLSDFNYTTLRELLDNSTICDRSDSEQLLSELGYCEDIPDHIQPYINWDSMAEDKFQDWQEFGDHYVLVD